MISADVSTAAALLTSTTIRTVGSVVARFSRLGGRMVTGTMPTDTLPYTNVPPTLPVPLRDLRPHRIHGSLDQPSPQPKQHLDQFSRFCTCSLL